MDEMPENQQSEELPPNPFQPPEKNCDDSHTPLDSPNTQFRNETENFLQNGHMNAFNGMEVAQDIIDEVLSSPSSSIQDPDATTMAMYGTPANRAAASKPYSDPDSDGGEGEGSGTRDATL